MHFNNVVLLNIYYNLDINSLFNCSLVNKHFNKLFDSDILWNKIIVNHYGNQYDDYIKELSLTNKPKVIYRIISDALVIKKAFDLCESPKKVIQMRHLSPPCTRLTELPKAIRSCVNLYGLSLYDQQLTELPKEIGCLTNMGYLELRGNKLSKLPNEICNMVNLRNLLLDKIDMYPEGYGNLLNTIEFNKARFEYNKRMHGLDLLQYSN